MAKVTDKQRDEIEKALRDGKPLPEIPGLIVDFSTSADEPYRIATTEEQTKFDKRAAKHHAELKRLGVTPDSGRRGRRVP